MKRDGAGEEREISWGWKTGRRGEGGQKRCTPGSRRRQHLRPEEPDEGALDVAVPEADQAADEDDEPEGARGEQVLGHAELGDIVRLQRLLHERE